MLSSCQTPARKRRLATVGVLLAAWLVASIVLFMLSMDGKGSLVRSGSLFLQDGAVALLPAPGGASTPVRYEYTEGWNEVGYELVLSLGEPRVPAAIDAAFYRACFGLVRGVDSRGDILLIPDGAGGRAILLSPRRIARAWSIRVLLAGILFVPLLWSASRSLGREARESHRRLNRRCVLCQQPLPDDGVRCTECGTDAFTDRNPATPIREQGPRQG